MPIRIVFLPLFGSCSFLDTIYSAREEQAGGTRMFCTPCLSWRKPQCAHSSELMTPMCYFSAPTSFLNCVLKSKCQRQYPSWNIQLKCELSKAHSEMLLLPSSLKLLPLAWQLLSVFPSHGCSHHTPRGSNTLFPVLIIKPHLLP